MTSMMPVTSMNDLSLSIGLSLWFFLFIKIAFNEENKVVTTNLYFVAWALLSFFPVVWLWVYFHVFLFEAIFGSIAYSKVILGTEQFGVNFEFITSWISLIMSTALFTTLIWWFYRLNNKLKMTGAK